MPALLTGLGLLVVIFCLINLFFNSQGESVASNSTIPLAKMSAAGLFYLIGAILGVFLLIIGLVFLLEDNKRSELTQAPGKNLIFPEGKLLSETIGNSIGNQGTETQKSYGTDAPAEEILAFYDTELAKLGYTPTTPTPDQTLRFDQDKLLKQYQNGSLIYRLYLFPLPQRVGGRTITEGYKHILYAKISN